MNQLSYEQLADLKSQLIAYQHQLQHQIQGIGAGLAQSMTQSVGELSAYDQHTSDLGAEVFERSKDLGLKDNLSVLTGKVQDALEAIDEGSYGICDSCGEPIDSDRLFAIPYTTLCYICSTRLSEGDRRPIEEEVLAPPFGRSFQDAEDYTGFDGEDAWQELARWGNANSPQDVPPGVDVSHAYVDADEAQGVVEEVEGLSRRPRH